MKMRTNKIIKERRAREKDSIERAHRLVTPYLDTRTPLHLGVPLFCAVKGLHMTLRIEGFSHMDGKIQAEISIIGGGVSLVRTIPLYRFRDEFTAHIQGFLYNDIPETIDRVAGISGITKEEK